MGELDRRTVLGAAACLPILPGWLRDPWNRGRLPGARWASYAGCACEVEGGDAPGIDCGMGFVPEGSRRLLWFYTEGS